VKDILVLRDIEEIKAVSHPYRLEIMEAFDNEPLSAKQLSEILGEPHAKVNYHIKTLLAAGILELVEERVKSGIIEKYYLPKAKMVVIDKSILNKSMENNDSEVTQTLNQASISLFEKVSGDFFRAAENMEIHSKHIIMHNEYYLAEDEAKELMETFSMKLKEIMAARQKTEDKKLRPYNIVFMAIPDLRREKKISKE